MLTLLVLLAALAVSTETTSAPAVMQQAEDQLRVPAAASAAGASEAGRSLAEELQALREQLKFLREEAAAATATGQATAKQQEGQEAAVQPGVQQRLKEELKQMREQLEVLRQTASGMAPTPPPDAAAPTDTPLPAPGGVPKAGQEKAQTQEVEDLRTQVRVLQELKQMREYLARLRAQIQMERDRLEGRLPEQPSGTQVGPDQGGGVLGYARPTLSVTPIQDEKGRFRLWINPLKWTLAPYKQNPEAAFELVHHSGDAFVFVIAENLSVPLNTIGKMALKNTQAIAPDAQLVSEEKRLVNGNEVLSVQIEGTLEGAIPIVYLGYYHSGQTGTVQVVASTTKPLFEKYQSDLWELLNGLEILRVVPPARR
jgi:hypothetical protein